MRWSTRRPLLFLLLTLLASAPLYLLNSLDLVLPFGLPPSVVMIVVPFLVAAGLILAEDGIAGVRRWLGSIVDVRRTRRIRWLIVALAIVPALMLAASGVARLTGTAPGGSPANPLVALVLVAVFWAGAVFEELGWTAYATHPLQQRYGVVPAGLLIGVVWAGWHVVPYLDQGRDLGWILLQGATTVVTRMLLGVLFRLTDEATFPAIGFHALLNATPEILPGGYGAFEPWVYALLLLAATIGLGLLTLPRSSTRRGRATGYSSPR